MNDYATPKRAYPGSRRNGTWKGRTTTIIVSGDKWDVPRGFGAAYLREADYQVDLLRSKKPAELLDRVRGCLGLVGYTASIDTVSDWPLRKRVEFVIWAQYVHLKASDNAVQVPPRPAWLPEPWSGPEQGEGVFATNPTVLT